MAEIDTQWLDSIAKSSSSTVARSERIQERNKRVATFLSEAALLDSRTLWNFTPSEIAMAIGRVAFNTTASVDPNGGDDDRVRACTTSLCCFVRLCQQEHAAAASSTPSTATRDTKKQYVSLSYLFARWSAANRGSVASSNSVTALLSQHAEAAFSTLPKTTSDRDDSDWPLISLGVERVTTGTRTRSSTAVPSDPTPSRNAKRLCSQQQKIV